MTINMYFTDGSVITNQEGAGVFRLNDKLELAIGIKNCDSSTAAELLAIHEALVYKLREPSNKTVTILCDSQSALSANQLVDACSLHATMVQEIVEVVRLIDRPVRMQYIPAYVRIFGNTLAELVAKKGAEQKRRTRILPKTITAVQREVWKDQVNRRT